MPAGARWERLLLLYQVDLRVWYSSSVAVDMEHTCSISGRSSAQGIFSEYRRLEAKASICADSAGVVLPTVSPFRLVTRSASEAGEAPACGVQQQDVGCATPVSAELGAQYTQCS